MQVVLGAPECQSYVFNEEGKVVLFTGGYIMDRLVGNTNKLGEFPGTSLVFSPDYQTKVYVFR